MLLLLLLLSLHVHVVVLLELFVAHGWLVIGKFSRRWRTKVRHKSFQIDKFDCV